VTCGVSLSDRGFLVGLWPALAFDPSGKLYFAYRDAQAGQFSTQDWAASDVELWEGLPPPTASTCVAAGDAAGGHNQLVIGAGNQPALVYDQMVDSADNLATNVVFQKRNPAGTWTTRVTGRNWSNFAYIHPLVTISRRGQVPSDDGGRGRR